ncbi:hypothetical protein FLAG1_05170 [Fusarium langsethiae]|uniref:Uncharacterized protein n=1 Tax=Fusarium langsethiae TaxID=179993 RepID=A0A0N0DF23_FUSLA|nr:hypothetical protein FLAG1_05170 [Fusarium langsethiae]GKU02653.1 unnamed protein product [Fusarium langsethiae]GKU19858.1 unnamed protein product [Fusarium langsethiae]
MGAYLVEGHSSDEENELYENAEWPCNKCTGCYLSSGAAPDCLPGPGTAYQDCAPSDLVRKLVAAGADDKHILSSSRGEKGSQDGRSSPPVPPVGNKTFLDVA